MLQKFDGSSYSIKQLRADYPNVSFPASYPDAALAPFGCRNVVYEPEPPYDERTQRLVEQPVALMDGVWTITWTVASMTQAQQLAYHSKRTLDAEQFEVFLIDSGLDDVFEAMVAAFKSNGNRVNLAKIRAFLKQDEFRLGTVMAIVDRFATQIANAFPALDVRKVTLIGHWDAAEATDLS